MTKRRWAALVYVCAVLLWGGACTFYLRSPALSDLEVASTLVIGSQGLATLTYPLGLLAGFLVRIAVDIGFEETDTWFAVVTPLAVLIGYWQWFHLFPWLFSSVARRRQSLQRSAGAEHRRGLLDRVIGMKRSRAVFLYISVILIVGLGSAGLNILPYYWSEFYGWLLENDFYGYATFAQTLMGFGLAGVTSLTFPAGALVFATVVLPLALIGIATPDQALFLATPFAALLGAVQWFWLLPKLYRRTPESLAEVF